MRIPVSGYYSLSPRVGPIMNKLLDFCPGMNAMTLRITFCLRYSCLFPGFSHDWLVCQGQLFHECSSSRKLVIHSVAAVIVLGLGFFFSFCFSSYRSLKVYGIETLRETLPECCLPTEPTFSLFPGS